MQNFGVNAAITCLGNAAALARGLGVSRPAVIQWQTGQRPVPPKRALQIEALTGGQVSRKDLCPDWRDYWPDMPASTTAPTVPLPGNAAHTAATTAVSQLPTL